MSPLAYLAQVGPLADADLLKATRETLNSGPRLGETVAVLGGALLLIGIIVVASRWTRRQNRPKADSLPGPLLRAAEAIGLSAEERRDLDQVARRARLAYPASMLLSPANLAFAAERAAREVPDAALRQRMGRVCRKLFDVALPEPDGCSQEGA